MNVIYLPCQIQKGENFKNILTLCLEVENFQGANITMPFKNLALEVLNLTHSNAVKETGAANTIYKDKTNNNWCLENTDIYGIKNTIEKLLPPNAHYNMLVLGGGGAATSCLYYGEKLDERCDKILCMTRNPDKTIERFPTLKNNKKLNIHALNKKNMNEIEEIIRFSSREGVYQLIINTIPPNKDSEGIENNLLVDLIKIIPINQICYFDMLYKSTFNLEFSKNHGIKCLDGLLMLEEQAKESFYLWTGVRP